MMDSGRLIFDSSSTHHGHMLVLGGGGTNSIYRGTTSMFTMDEGSNKRRPFFTSPEDLLEEEYYDEQLPEKKRRLTPEQVHMLEKSFESENKLEPERKSELAKKLGLQPRQVAVWFQNRRARWKTKQLERDFDRLKAAYDSLLVDHDAQIKDNDRLRAQVICLTEKLQGKDLSLPVGPTEEPTEDGAGTIRVEAKLEDHLSTGSADSAIVDSAVVDSMSGNSYFQEFVGPASAANGDACRAHSSSDEDPGSDDGCNYAAGGLFTESHTHSDHNNPWWTWN